MLVSLLTHSNTEVQSLTSVTPRRDSCTLRVGQRGTYVSYREAVLRHASWTIRGLILMLASTKIGIHPKLLNAPSLPSVHSVARGLGLKFCATPGHVLREST